MPLNSITKIQVESPVEIIYRQLKQLIVSGDLKQGDKLPAERVLAEKFGVGRGYVREAIAKLEFHGLLKTSPQSGTYVTSTSIKVLDNLLSDIINFNHEDFSAMIETRFYLEVSSARLAAERRNEEDLEEIEKAMMNYDAKAASGVSAIEEDMQFHVMIAKASKNSVLESMILNLIPNLIKCITENNICGKKRGIQAIDEHRVIFNAIRDQDLNAAERAMSIHLDEILQLSRLGISAELFIKSNQKKH
jgi:GntR family transcriptional regulator, transcriptional repressor for pyruvate dehydrogenase complex